MSNIFRDLRTKVICTIGPACQSPEMLKKMIEGGMDGARLNFSHGDPAEHVRIIHLVREISRELNKPTAIIQDLTGPKIRIGKFEKPPIHLAIGDQFTLTTKNILGNKQRVTVNYENLPNEIEPGTAILLNDGNITLTVLDIKGEDILCNVVNGGDLSDNKGVNVPDCNIGVSTLTSKDLSDLKIGVEAQVDYVAVSFVRTVDDIRLARNYLGLDGLNIDIIAKLETKQAVKNLDKIMEEADGIMIARGDLGIELPIEELPALQKIVIKKANRAGKIVITATQMLESMVENPMPTRAEASDVANAIYDGSGTIMLSGETSVGAYPLKALEMMRKIIKSTEFNILKLYNTFDKVSNTSSTRIADAICSAAGEIAQQVQAKAIVVFTQSGYTAISISKVRPYVPIIAFTPNEFVRNRMNIYWGIHSACVELSDDMTMMLNGLREHLIAGYGFSDGDVVVVVLGFPIKTSGVTNLIKVHKLKPL